MKYLKQYKEMHKMGKFNGKSLKKHLKRIFKELKLTDSKTVLDYGCGKAKHHPDGWAKYEPALDEFSELPDGPFDAVICTDVLEHVPEEELSETLWNIFSRAEKLVYLNIATKPAKKKLPNGENAHCTVRPKEWWENKIEDYKENQKVIIQYD